MALQTTGTRISYTGNGVTTTFAYTFRALEAGHLKVYVNGLLQLSGYSVTGVGAANGGNIVFNTAPVLNSSVVIIRQLPLTQPVDTVNNETILENVIDTGFDRLTMQIQQVATGLERTLSLDPTDTYSGALTLPVTSLRAGNLLAFDSNGAPIALNPDGTELLVNDVAPSVLSFTGDGVTTTYQLNVEVPDKRLVRVFIGGVHQSQNQYSVFGRNLILSEAAPAGAEVEVVVSPTIAVQVADTGGNAVVGYLTGDGTTTVFTMTGAAATLTASAALIVDFDGAVQAPSSYALNGAGSIIFTEAPPQGVEITYRSVALGARGPAGPPGDMANPMTTAGDLIFGGVSGTPTRLPAGATGTFLKGGTTPAFSAFALSDMPNQAQNTVVGRTASGSGAPSAISTPMIGVITAADAAAARTVLGVSVPGATLLSVGTASNSATVDVTGIDGTYDAYMVVFSGVVPVSDGASLVVRFREGGTFQTTTYLYSLVRSDSSGTAVSSSVGASSAQTPVAIGVGNDGTNGEATDGVLTLINPSSTTRTKTLLIQSQARSTANVLQTFYGAGSRGSLSAVDGLRFLFDTGNISSGSFYLYGLRKTV